MWQFVCEPFPRSFMGKRFRQRRDKVTLLGITIDNLDYVKPSTTILEWLHNETSKQVCFVNADCVNIAYRDETYLEGSQRALIYAWRMELVSSSQENFYLRK